MMAWMLCSASLQEGLNEEPFPTPHTVKMKGSSLPWKARKEIPAVSSHSNKTLSQQDVRYRGKVGGDREEQTKPPN